MTNKPRPSDILTFSETVEKTTSRKPVINYKVALPIVIKIVLLLPLATLIFTGFTYILYKIFIEYN